MTDLIEKILASARQSNTAFTADDVAKLLSLGGQATSTPTPAPQMPAPQPATPPTTNPQVAATVGPVCGKEWWPRAEARREHFAVTSDPRHRCILAPDHQGSCRCMCRNTYHGGYSHPGTKVIVVHDKPEPTPPQAPTQSKAEAAGERDAAKDKAKAFRKMSKGPQECGLCGQVFMGRAGIMNHRKLAHSAEHLATIKKMFDSNAGTFTCTCGYVDTHYGRAVYHQMRTHNKPKPEAKAIAKALRAKPGATPAVAPAEALDPLSGLVLAEVSRLGSRGCTAMQAARAASIMEQRAETILLKLLTAKQVKMAKLPGTSQVLYYRMTGAQA